MKMKYLLIALCTIGLLGAPAAFASEGPQKVCVDKLGKDGQAVKGKDGKPVQVCKQMKVHKKLEGTQVPDKK